MPRYKLTIEYDGTPFAGWQIQADQPTVQGVLTTAIEALSGEKTPVQGAGRTDAGVHARGQVAHVDLTKDWETDTVRDALNAHLRPHPVAILSARAGGGRLQCPHLGDQTPLPLPHHQPPRRSDARRRSRLAGAAPARCRGHARGGAAAHRQARFHHLPLDRMPGQVAAQDARPARRRAPGRRRASCGRRRARSCTARCARWSARW